MSKERLIWQGQKQEKTLAAKKLSISISGLINNVRTILNPHTAYDQIDSDEFTQQAFELSDKLIKYKQLCREIDAINKSLGIE